MRIRLGLPLVVSLAALGIVAMDCCGLPQHPAPPSPSNTAVSPTVAELKAKVEQWLAATFAPTADRDIVRKLSANVAESLGRDKNVRIILDGEMTADGTARFALTWGGRLHTFKISQAQCRAAGVAARGAAANHIDRDEADQPLSPAPFVLDSLQVDNLGKITGDQSITGSVVCRLAPGQSPPAGSQIVVRVMCRSERSLDRSFRFIDAIPADGVIKFALDPINRGLGGASNHWHFGPTPLVVDLLLTSADAEVGKGLVASNAVGVVIDVLPDPEGYMQASLAFMEEVVAILVSVQDAASAEKALADLQSSSLRNASLADAMERMPPLPPERDSELSAKYEARLQAVATKMQEQLTRLEQAPYAGEAFFEKFEKMMAGE
jgi:hypothetical protein